MADMKVLSIRQPWATLICLGVKPIENRTWQTKHRGALAIHASGQNLLAKNNESALEIAGDYFPKPFQTAIKKREQEIDSALEQAHAAETPDFASYFAKEKSKVQSIILQDLTRFMYYLDLIDAGIFGQVWQEKAENDDLFSAGEIIGEVQVTDCIHADKQKEAFGFKDPWADKRGWLWRLKEPQLYETPEFAKGAQGLWNIPD